MRTVTCNLRLRHIMIGDGKKKLKKSKSRPKNGAQIITKKGLDLV
jgi:hypothetical protein